MVVVMVVVHVVVVHNNNNNNNNVIFIRIYMYYCNQQSFRFEISFVTCTNIPKIP